MAFSGTKDLTNGKPVRLILGFALPLMFGVVFQQLYNMVDSAIVGKFLGADKLGAVGSTGSINFLIVGFCLGMCSGFSIPISQRFGAGDYSEMRRYVFNSIYLTAAFGIIFAVVTAVFCPQILTLMNTQEHLFESSVSYIRVIFMFIPVTMAYNMSSGILRALGDSKTPVLFLTIAALMNVVLDLFFIVVLKLEVAGAAWATIISQLFSGVGCTYVLIKKFNILRPQGDEKKPRPAYMKTLVFMGAPMGLQFSLTAVGSVVLQTAVNSVSEQAVSAVAAAGKLYQLFASAYDALANTMATYAGQNVGARKLKRVDEGLIAAGIIGTIYSVFAILILFMFSKQLLLIFLKPEETEIIALASQFIKCNSSLFVFLLIVNIVRLAIQGMGFTRVAMIAGILEMFARAGIALLFVPKFGFDVVCFANPAAWIAADLFLVPCYIYTMRRLKENSMAVLK